MNERLDSRIDLIGLAVYNSALHPIVEMRPPSAKAFVMDNSLVYCIHYTMYTIHTVTIYILVVTQGDQKNFNCIH